MSRLRSFLHYLGCGLLVVSYVNLFVVWSRLDQLLGRGTMNLLPVAVTFLVLTGIVLFVVHLRGKGISIQWAYVGAGVGLCLLALLASDMRYAVKRIHVVEYLFLSLVVRYCMSWKLQGKNLLLYSFLAAAVFGVHDELLQGIHPLRTYGLRDMAVNGISAAGGALIWHGADLFPGNQQSSTGNKTRSSSAALLLYILWLVIAVPALVVPLTAYRYDLIPYWPMLPLAGGLVFWFLYGAGFAPSSRHGLVVLSWLSFLLLCYPVVINVASIPFG